MGTTIESAKKIAFGWHERDEHTVQSHADWVKRAFDRKCVIDPHSLVERQAEVSAKRKTSDKKISFYEFLYFLIFFISKFQFNDRFILQITSFTSFGGGRIVWFVYYFVWASRVNDFLVVEHLEIFDVIPDPDVEYHSEEHEDGRKRVDRPTVAKREIKKNVKRSEQHSVRF